jgi:hypothetical protein
MYRLLEAAAAMRLTSGCQARWISLELKSCCRASVGPAAGSGEGLALPFRAVLFVLLPLESPNLPVDCTNTQ